MKDVFKPSKEWATPICMHEVFPFQKRKGLRERIRGRTWETLSERNRDTKKEKQTGEKKYRQRGYDLHGDSLQNSKVTTKLVCKNIFKGEACNFCTTSGAKQNCVEKKKIYIYYTKQVSNQFHHYYVEHPVSLFKFVILNKLNANASKWILYQKRWLITLRNASFFLFFCITSFLICYF